MAYCTEEYEGEVEDLLNRIDSINRDILLARQRLLSATARMDPHDNQAIYGLVREALQILDEAKP